MTGLRTKQGARLLVLWRDLHDPGHWVLQVGRRLIHFYDWSHGRKRHLYLTRHFFPGDELNLPDDEPEFRQVWP